MTCVNEYCRRSRAHRFTRKQLHRIKHLPWVRADLTHVQTPHGFICSIRASCVAVLTGIVYGWWQDSLHQRVISMKGRVHTLKWDIRKMPWKETAGKVLSAKTIQRQAVKKKYGWNWWPKVQIFFPHECSCSSISCLQFCTSFCHAVS